MSQIQSKNNNNLIFCDIITWVFHSERKKKKKVLSICEFSPIQMSQCVTRLTVLANLYTAPQEFTCLNI